MYFYLLKRVICTLNVETKMPSRDKAQGRKPIKLHEGDKKNVEVF
jgi:hypothetical protein